MKRILTQTLRGCRRLPHVGEHPGTEMMVFIAAVGLVAGGWVGFLIVSPFVGLYLWGAYDRAEYSDRITRREDV